MDEVDVSDDDLILLTETIREKYGYQFGAYHRSLFTSRISTFLKEEGSPDLKAFARKLLYCPRTFERLIAKVTNGTTEFFREPTAFLTLRHMVIPLLRNIPFFTIWHAGCSTGEEVYSMAILLDQANLLHRARLVGTDINQAALAVAARGTYSQDEIQTATKSYQASGGTKPLLDYFEGRRAHYTLVERLRRHTSFFRHDLATDGSIGEVNLVFCRNVLIYFTPTVVDQVSVFLDTCLAPPGIVCLGKYEKVSKAWKIRGFSTLSNEENILMKSGVEERGQGKHLYNHLEC